MSREGLNLAKVVSFGARSMIITFPEAFALAVQMVCMMIGALKLGISPENFSRSISQPERPHQLSVLALVSNFCRNKGASNKVPY